MTTINEIRKQTTRIQDAYETIEDAVVTIASAKDWRIALGFVEDVNRCGYQLRKRMLDEAIRASRVPNE